MSTSTSSRKSGLSKNQSVKKDKAAKSSTDKTKSSTKPEGAAKKTEKKPRTNTAAVRKAKSEKTAGAGATTMSKRSAKQQASNDMGSGPLAIKSSTNGSAVDMSILESKLGYQIRMADRILNKEFFQNVGMTPVQFSVFSLVATNENLSQVAIGEALSMDRASTMAIVHKLELAGLLERRTSPHDRRMHALQLTDKGKKEFTAVNKRVVDHDNIFRNRMSKGEIETLLSCIRKLQG